MNVFPRQSMIPPMSELLAGPMLGYTRNSVAVREMKTQTEFKLCIPAKALCQWIGIGYFVLGNFAVCTATELPLERMQDMVITL